MAERVARTIAEYRAAAQNPSKDAASPAVQRALTMLTRKVAELESALRQSNQVPEARCHMPLHSERPDRNLILRPSHLHDRRSGTLHLRRHRQRSTT